MWPIVLSFTIVLASFLAVGLSANFRARSTTGDYLMAGREIHPWLVGFAAASTNSSGFMFIGLIGTTVTDGLSAMWLMVGWIVGDWFAWMIIHERLRQRSGELHADSVSSYISAGLSRTFPAVRILCALLTIAFLATYAAAQFTAGSKALETLLGWRREFGILMGFGLLMLYCFSGGLRASIWVNTAQSFVMIGSVMLLLGVALYRIGGLEAMWSKLAALDPKYVDWQPQNLIFGFPPYMLSWIGAGAGVIGQPHLMTIAMSIESSEQMYRARRVYFVWYWIFSVCCILVGLCCRVWLNDMVIAGFDREMALPELAKELLPGALVGVILGGLFAATLSTADTQIICASAALTQDLVPAWGRTYAGTKLGMLMMGMVVVVTALYGPGSVFALVVLSWSCLAASLGPILAAQTFRWPLNNFVGVAMMLGGLLMTLAWSHFEAIVATINRLTLTTGYQIKLPWPDGSTLSGSIYEVLPGMLAGFAVYAICRPFLSQPTTEAAA